MDHVKSFTPSTARVDLGNLCALISAFRNANVNAKHSDTHTRAMDFSPKLLGRLALTKVWVIHIVILK